MRQGLRCADSRYLLGRLVVRRGIRLSLLPALVLRKMENTVRMMSVTKSADSRPGGVNASSLVAVVVAMSADAGAGVSAGVARGNDPRVGSAPYYRSHGGHASKKARSSMNIELQKPVHFTSSPGTWQIPGERFELPTVESRFRFTSKIKTRSRAPT